MMDHLWVEPIEVNTFKAKALENAKQMQQSVIASAEKVGKVPPKYVLKELVGKGSFGRVYKA